jgi:hypothetical protein
MRFNHAWFVLLLLCCTALQAKEDKALPMDLIELLGEWDEEEQAALEDVLVDVQSKPAKKQPPASSSGDQQ